MELGKLSLLSRAEPAAGPLLGAEARARVQLMRRQLGLWGALWAIFGVLAFMPLAWYIVNQAAVKNQIQAAAELQIETGQLQRFAPMAAAGNPVAFPVLREID